MLKKIFQNNPEKAEMSFFDHLEELRWHIIRSVAVIMVFAVVIFVKINYVYDVIILAPTRQSFITYRALCWLSHAFHLSDTLCLSDVPLQFQNMKLSGQFLQAMSSAFTFGLIISTPYVLWEFWRFVKPALKPNELKYTRGIIFWTSLLFFAGVGFGYFLITPYTVNFFAAYKISESIQNIITINSYLSTISQLVLGCGILFQLPIVVYFLAKAGIITPDTLRNYRKHAFVVILVIAAVITPPDVASQIIVTIPLWILYETGIVIATRVIRRQEEEDAREWS